MNIKYKVDMEDLVAFNQYFVATSPFLRRHRLIVIAVISSIYIILEGVQALARDSITPLLLWSGIAVVFGVLYYRASLKVSPKHIARLYSSEKNNGIFCEHELAILPEGIHEKTDVNEQLSAFSEIERIEITDTHVFIFIGTMQAHVIPKNKVLEGDLDAFVSALRGKMDAVTKLS